jgi:CheY-like chemotaxis protein
LKWDFNVERFSSSLTGVAKVVLLAFLNNYELEPMNMITQPSQTVPMDGGARVSVEAKVNVWLVDDNDQLRTMVGDLLDREGGIECTRQFSGPDELLFTLASKPGPDVILLDVQMGERNGLDAVRPIKSLTPTTRVLMFTTCFDSERRERALNEGASDYLLKSYPLKKVADRIRCPANDVKSSRLRGAIAPAVQPADEIGRNPWLLGRVFVMFREVCGMQP